MKNPASWECDYCESKKLEHKRDCGWDQLGDCKNCGPVKFEDVYTEQGSSKFYCDTCNGTVKFSAEFRLGKTYSTPGCPASRQSDRANFWINLVHWSEVTGKLPSASTLLEESQLYYEIRNFVLSEQVIAEEELTPKEKTK